jgi:hypothetical protein
VRNLVCVFTALFASISLVSAQSQVATATSTAPFQLRGASVTTDQGVPSWPVLPGNEIKAGSAPVVITFAGGSTIPLSPGASAKITMDGQTPHFVLQCGSASYTLSAPSAVKLNAPASTQTTGNYSESACGDRPAAGWWTTGHTLLVVGGAAGAAGLAFGVAHAVTGSPAVSPL